MDVLAKVIGALWNGTIVDLLGTMSGPDFLSVYLLWFLLTVQIAVLVRRLMDVDDIVARLFGAALFLGVGAARMYLGSAHGLHKWEYLTLAMLVGTVCFFIGIDTWIGYGGSGYSSCGMWYGCSTGGGCGGGGGGGGCGGCGGS